MTPEARELFELAIEYTFDAVCFLSVSACIGWLIWVANHKGRVE